MDALKIARVVIQVVSLGTAVASAILSGKELSAKVAAEVAKQLENK